MTCNKFVVGVIFIGKVLGGYKMQRIKKLTAIILSILTLSSICVFGTSTSASASGTGAGLAEWALNAYYSGWAYVYGGATPGAVDCSGLIYSYAGGERCGNPQLNTATETGYVSNGIPRVHGLGLWRPGHVGVYIGDGMEVDARNEDAGVCYQSVASAYMGWTYWFRLAAVSYVYNGWEEFNGDYYYYEGGQYIVDTSRNIDGTTYYFDSKGRSSETPSDASNSSYSDEQSSSSSEKVILSSFYKKGSSGEEVTKIQERLSELGYYNGSIDGYFGAETVTAYKAFQQAAGLTVDGISGSDRDVLYSDDAPYAPVEKVEEKSEEVVKTEAVENEVNKNTEDNSDKADTEENVTYKLDDENEEVLKIQSRLSSLGYFTVAATGYYGEYTEQSVKAFQKANGLEETGVVDKATYELLNSDKAVFNPHLNVSTPDTATAESGPSQLLSGNVSDYIMTNATNQSYADTASEVASKTKTITNQALSKSSSVIPSATTAEAKKTASVWMWFVLVAVILGALAVTFYIRDYKETRYARYLERKKKSSVPKATQASSRW